MGTFKKKTRVDTEIPASSMADLAFLLLIFFMVSTVFKTEQGLKIILPEAEMTVKIQKRRDVRHVWVNRAGTINVDDLPMSSFKMAQILNGDLQKNPGMIVGIRADALAPYTVVNDVLAGCQLAGAFRVQFATTTEK